MRIEYEDQASIDWIKRLDDPDNTWSVFARIIHPNAPDEVNEREPWFHVCFTADPISAREVAPLAFAGGAQHGVGLHEDAAPEEASRCQFFIQPVIPHPDKDGEFFGGWNHFQDPNEIPPELFTTPRYADQGVFNPTLEA